MGRGKVEGKVDFSGGNDGTGGDEGMEGYLLRKGWGLCMCVSRK